jgi:hypothetical protein
LTVPLAGPAVEVALTPAKETLALAGRQLLAKETLVATVRPLQLATAGRAVAAAQEVPAGTESGLQPRPAGRGVRVCRHLLAAAASLEREAAVAPVAVQGAQPGPAAVALVALAVA